MDEAVVLIDTSPPPVRVMLMIHMKNTTHRYSWYVSRGTNRPSGKRSGGCAMFNRGTVSGACERRLGSMICSSESSTAASSIGKVGARGLAGSNMGKPI